MSRIVDVIIPAFNEAPSIGLVLDAIPRQHVREVIVVDNDSSDDTAEVAQRHGARTVRESRRGYGSACLAGMAARAGRDGVVVFLDGDFSDHPEQLPDLVDPIFNGEQDFVLGSRILGPNGKSALLPQSYWGNRLATTLIRWLFGHRYTDLGPFRAIRSDVLAELGMCDQNFGWTVEMQIRAVRAGLRILEVPVRYRQRVGVSKITGTVRGTIRAGWKILWLIFRYGILERPSR
ncbi:MAG: glycosyltransferase family 2 protein [Planctomycetota bacterium]